MLLGRRLRTSGPALRDQLPRTEVVPRLSCRSGSSYFIVVALDHITKNVSKEIRRSLHFDYHSSTGSLLRFVSGSGQIQHRAEQRRREIPRTLPRRFKRKRSLSLYNDAVYDGIPVASNSQPDFCKSPGGGFHGATRLRRSEQQCLGLHSISDRTCLCQNCLSSAFLNS